MKAVFLCADLAIINTLGKPQKIIIKLSGH